MLLYCAIVFSEIVKYNTIMFKKLFRPFFNFLEKTIHSPIRVLILCSSLALVSLVFDQTLFQLWQLNNEENNMLTKNSQLNEKILDITQKIKSTNDLDFLAKEAREHYDLATDKELVFMFSEDKDDEDVEFKKN